MRTTHLTAVLTAAAIAVTPTAAFAQGASDGAGKPTSPGKSQTAKLPGPNSSAASKAKAYGKFCQNQSKKKVEGQKGTAFSRCVTAMAKASTAKGSDSSPAKACKAMSKKKLPGQTKSEYAKCVVAAAKAKKAAAAPAPAPTPAS